MQCLSIVIPSFHSKSLTEIAVKSFVHFCPKSISLEIIVIENSDDESYKNEILNISDSVVWINNDKKIFGSEANASALELGAEIAKNDMVFFAHCDICVTSSKFYSEIFRKYEEGNRAVGMLYDNHPDRINALHILGLLTEKSIVKSVDLYPKYKGKIQILDVGDSITSYCRDNNIPYFSFENTYNDSKLKVEKPYEDFSVVRTISQDGEVIYMHLGRGIAKNENRYRKKNRVMIDDWVHFCNILMG